MRKLITIVLILVVNVMFAEKITFSSASTGLKTSNPAENIRVFTNTISEIDVTKMIVQGQNFTALDLEGYVFHGEIGDPRLPAKTQLLEVPMGATVEINILSSAYTDINLSQKGFKNQLLPVQPSVRKSATEMPALVKNAAAYSKNTFNVRDIVDVFNLGIAKDRQFTQLNICPIQYLPSENIIRVYHHIEFEVTYVGGQPKTIFSQKPLVYQIISHRAFETTLVPFITWKTEKGFDVRVAYTDDIGGTGATLRTNIKNYLQGIYDNPATRADFLLLVGDNTAIPAYANQVTGYGTHVTDLYYADYTNDNLPDIQYGRLSGASGSPIQISNQIEKILAMEKMNVPSLDFFNKATFVAGKETGIYRRIADATVDYAANNYWNVVNGSANTAIFKEANNNTNTQGPNVRASLNEGRSYINYTAHCNFDRWDDQTIITSHVSSFTNENKYPLMIGNCCLSAKFEVANNIGTELMRAQRKGAVTYIGGSNNTYWTEDFHWSVGSGANASNPETATYANTGLGVYDRAWHLNGEARSDWAYTASEIVFWGNMAVQGSSATPNTAMKRYYWEIYHVLGDPSYIQTVTTPQPLPVNDLGMMMTIDEELYIETVPYAYVGFSMNGQLLGGGMTDHLGQITLTFDEELPYGEALLVITAKGYIPYIETVQINLADRPLISVPNYKLSINSTPTEHCVFGETIDFSMLLKNRALVAANQIYVTLSMVGKDDFVQIIQTSTPISVLNGEDSVWVSGRQLVISTDIPNRYNVEILATITYSDTLTLEHTFNLLGAAPEFVISGFNTTEINGSFTITNVGLEPIIGTQVQLVNQGDNVTVSNFSPTTANFTLSTAIPFTFDLQKAPGLPEFVTFGLGLSIAKGDFSYTRTLNSAFGILVEDFETGSFLDGLWIGDGLANFDWYIDSLHPFQGKYCMRSKKINHNETASMVTDMFELVGGDSIVFYYKVSSEDCRGNSGCIDGGDALRFSISDGNTWTELQAWYGEIPWTRAAFAMNEGIHYFQWAYTKNPTQNRGSDAAWVDYIVFPKAGLVPPVPSVSIIPPIILPDHIRFDIVVNNGHLQARINAETPGKATIRLFNMLGQPVGLVCNNSAVHVGQNDFYFDLSN
ncbi:MAG: C25 family cysteine peptidase, partial [Bacteroidales bacterium]|nr:C25 family cysteine peptidase [Bacteroidales bacterium]